MLIVNMLEALTMITEIFGRDETETQNP